MTLVSVVMSVHNQGAEARAAIESIQAQTYPHWEMWVVDDASTDTTDAVLQAAACADERIWIIRNPRNLGLAASLNRALACSRGELIARMDADDISLPERFERQVAFLEASPAVDVLGGGAIELDASGRVLWATFCREHHAELIQSIFRVCPFIHPTVMVRRRFFEVLGGYDERLRRVQDYDLWLRGYRFFRFHNLQVPLILYRRRSAPRFRDHATSALVLWRAAKREGKVISHGWYAVRQLVGFGAWHLGYRKRRGACRRAVS